MKSRRARIHFKHDSNKLEKLNGMDGFIKAHNIPKLNQEERTIQRGLI